MKIKESRMSDGSKMLTLTLTLAEVRQIALDSFIGPAVGYWFDAIENDSEYSVRIDIDRSEDGTVQHHGD